jgi:hypothetical protein
MRKKFSTRPSRHPHPHAVEQLLQVKVELYRELNRFNEAVLQQARAFNEHVSSCTSMANNIANLVATRPSLVQPLVQPEKDNTLLSTLANFMLYSVYWPFVYIYYLLDCAEHVV